VTDAADYPVSVWDVLARWAYTEIADAHSSLLYDGSPAAKALRSKRSAGVGFDALSAEERILLVSSWHGVRRLANVRAYRIEQWTRAQLMTVRLPLRG
jgi:hypothetical protein